MKIPVFLPRFFFSLKAQEILKAAVTSGHLKWVGTEKLQQHFQGIILQHF